MKYLTDNAYIQVAVSSESFCPSAFKAFFLIIRHADRFFSMAVVDWIMICLGKGAIISASGFATFYITKQYYPSVNQPFVPTVIVSVIAYIEASLFLAVYTFSSRTILHCFLIDEDNGNENIAPDCLKGFIELGETHRASAKHREKLIKNHERS